MRKEGRGEERDMTTHLIKFQVFTHAGRVTNFSTHNNTTSTSSTRGLCLVRSMNHRFSRLLLSV